MTDIQYYPKPPLDPRGKTLTFMYRAMLMVLVVMSVGLITIGTVQTFRISDYLKQQQSIELHYLHCIGQIPLSQRTPENTNACFVLPSR